MFATPFSLSSEEGIQRFQDGLLDEKDEAWYKLVPPEAREVLDKKEVQRQSVIFEFIASERDYVNDLKLVQDVFVEPLFATSPVPRDRVKQFVSEVFYNLNEILEHHDRMLKALFTRQQDQHPLIQSVADIVLDSEYLHSNLPYTHNHPYSSQPRLPRFIREIHQTLSPRRSPPPQRTQTQSQIPILPRPMFTRPTHSQTRLYHLPQPTYHTTPPDYPHARANSEIHGS